MTYSFTVFNVAQDFPVAARFRYLQLLAPKAARGLSHFRNSSTKFLSPFSVGSSQHRFKDLEGDGSDIKVLLEDWEFFRALEVGPDCLAGRLARITSARGPVAGETAGARLSSNCAVSLMTLSIRVRATAPNVTTTALNTAHFGPFPQKAHFQKPASPGLTLPKRDQRRVVTDQ